MTLGPLDLIADGNARNFVLEMRAGRFHGFVVRRGKQVFGYVDRCAHMPVPLSQQLDAYLTPDVTHIGMAALEMPARIRWNIGYVALSILLGAIPFVPALTLAVRRSSVRSGLAAACLMAVAVVSGT